MCATGLYEGVSSAGPAHLGRESPQPKVSVDLVKLPPQLTKIVYSRGPGEMNAVSRQQETLGGELDRLGKQPFRLYRDYIVVM